MQFDPGSVGSVTISNPKDTDGNPDPFVTGDTVAFQILNAADQSVAADQGSFGPAVFSADNLSAVIPFTRPQATGVFLLRPTLTNVDGTPAIGTDVPFGVAVPVKDITSFDTAIS